MTRNQKGIIGWFCISLVINIVALIPMVLRELYQWKRYNLKAFEWDDIKRYGFTIMFGSLLEASIILGILGCCNII